MKKVVALVEEAMRTVEATEAAVRVLLSLVRRTCLEAHRVAIKTRTKTQGDIAEARKKLRVVIEAVEDNYGSTSKQLQTVTGQPQCRYGSLSKELPAVTGRFPRRAVTVTHRQRKV